MLLSYIRLVVMGDDLSFERVVNTPSRGIGAKTLERSPLTAQDMESLIMKQSASS